MGYGRLQPERLSVCLNETKSHGSVGIVFVLVWQERELAL
jgi:hypothetical protein